MPYDSSGNFSRLYNWEEDRQNDVNIMSDRMDAEDDNFADGLSQCLLKSGQVPMTGDLKMANFQIKSLANGTASNDAVNKSQLDALNTTLSNLITTRINTMLSSLYPVGSVYIGTQSTCPLATLISGSTWTKVATKVAISVPTSVSVYGNGKNLVLNKGVSNIGLCSNSSGDHTVAPQWTTSTNVSIGTSVTAYRATGGSSKAAGVVTDGSISGLTGSIAASTYLTVNIWKRTA